MYVIWHHNISNQKETITISHLSKYFREHTSGASRAKQRQPPIASARQKMQIVFAIISFEIFGHECGTTKPHPLRAAKDGPPRFAVLLPGEYNQWYHRRAISERREKCRKGGPPATNANGQVADNIYNVKQTDGSKEKKYSD